MNKLMSLSFIGYLLFTGPLLSMQTPASPIEGTAPREIVLESFGKKPLTPAIVNSLFPISICIWEHSTFAPAEGYPIFPAPFTPFDSIDTLSRLATLNPDIFTMDFVWEDGIVKHLLAEKSNFMQKKDINNALKRWVNGEIEWVCDEPVIFRKPLKEKLQKQGISEEDAEWYVAWLLTKIDASFPATE